MDSQLNLIIFLLFPGIDCGKALKCVGIFLGKEKAITTPPGTFLQKPSESELKEIN